MRYAIAWRRVLAWFFFGFVSAVRGLLSSRKGLSKMASIHISLSFLTFPTEATMSAKKRRKIYGVRRESRRTRGWTRWFQEGFFETERRIAFACARYCGAQK